MPAAALRRPFGAAARLRTAIVPSRRLRRRLLVLVTLALALVGLYSFWLRDSSLVAVEQVTITGVTSKDAKRVRAALTSTAETMTTLHFDERRLERAVAAFPVVAAIEVTPDFPNGMAIHVVEHRPVAILDLGGEGVPVAGDGSILSGVAVKGELPTIELSGALPHGQLPPGAALDSARVAGGAPPVVARRLESIGREDGARGVVVQVEGGPEIVFGTTERVRAKWAAAIRVLADEEAAGAAYIDVSIPERPVAGGLPVETVTPVAPADAPVIDPEAVAPDPALVTPPADDTAAVPEPAPEAVAPAPQAPVAPVPPTGGGGVVP